MVAVAEEKERFVRQLFDSITPRYDWFNRVSSFGMDQGWRARAIESVKLLPGMRVLDLASGTGDLAAAAAEKLAPLGRVAAFDLSYPMLNWGRRAMARHPLAAWHVSFAQGRAEALPFADRSFEALTCGFALRNVSDLDRTFSEMRRVLKVGGRFGILEFSRPRNPLLSAGHTVWLSTGIPALGWTLTGRFWPFVYLRRSIFQFPPPAEAVKRLERAGFREVEAIPLTGGVVILYTGTRR